MSELKRRVDEMIEIVEQPEPLTEEEIAMYEAGVSGGAHTMDWMQGKRIMATIRDLEGKIGTLTAQLYGKYGLYDLQQRRMKGQAIRTELEKERNAERERAEKAEGEVTVWWEAWKEKRDKLAEVVGAAVEYLGWIDDPEMRTYSTYHLRSVLASLDAPTGKVLGGTFECGICEQEWFVDGADPICSACRIAGGNALTAEVGRLREALKSISDKPARYSSGGGTAFRTWADAGDIAQAALAPELKDDK